MPHTVILGAGIIGTSTAYYLTHSPAFKNDHRVTILDTSPPASGASGKSGGFIARNWAGPASASLAELSFRLHDELAREHGGTEKWGYRRCRAVSVVGVNGRGNPLGDLARTVRFQNVKETAESGQLEWIKRGVIQSTTLLGDKDATSQCDPYLLTTFLLEAAEAKGAEYIQARATNLSTEANKVKIVHATRVDGSTISLTCDNLVFATGPWTGQLSRTLLGKTIPITSYAGHSIIVRPATAASEDCLFMTLSTEKSSYHPEIFPRLSGQVYICGVNDTLPLPESPDTATPRPRDMNKLRDIASFILGEYTVDAEQLCFRPMTEHGEPFVSAVPGAEGVWVGAGHSFWGITLGPGTGRVLSEMILGEDLSADIGQLSLCNAR